MTNSSKVDSDKKKILHIGLGAFFKAHQAWYTQKSDVAKNWEIIAFTGRGPAAANELKENGYKYNLITRGPAEDVSEVIDCVTQAFDSSEVAIFNEYLADPNVALVTLTITESAYTTDVDGPIYRLFKALKGRFENGAMPIAIVPCDNLAQNGQIVRNLFTQLAANETPEFQSYIKNKVSIVSTSVDRITPKSEIRNSVITEPYSAWILQGQFPLGRPNWEIAGAQFVQEVAPFERRKLWLLNGSHSYLAYAGSLKGYQTVAEAITDDEIRALVEKLWDEDSQNLPAEELNLNKYRNDLISRFSNARIEHKLSQIAIDGSLKLRERIVPVILGQLGSGRSYQAAATVISNWITFVTTCEFADANKSKIDSILDSNSSSKNYVEKLVELLSPELAKNREFVSSIELMVDANKKAKIC